MLFRNSAHSRLAERTISLYESDLRTRSDSRLVTWKSLRIRGQATDSQTDIGLLHSYAMGFRGSLQRLRTQALRTLTHHLCVRGHSTGLSGCETWCFTCVS